MTLQDNQVLEPFYNQIKNNETFEKWVNQQLTKITSIIQTNLHILLELKIITAPEAPGKLGPKIVFFITTTNNVPNNIYS